MKAKPKLYIWISVFVFILLFPFWSGKCLGWDSEKENTVFIHHSCTLQLSSSHSDGSLTLMLVCQAGACPFVTFSVLIEYICPINYHLLHYPALKQCFPLLYINNNIIAAVWVCPAVLKSQSPFHTRYVTWLLFHCCKVLHNAASFVLGEKKA